MIRLKEVSKDYVQGEKTIQVLQSLSIELKDQQTVAVVGSSGSGKSTLLTLLAGLDKPTKGTVEVLGQDLGNMDQDALSDFRAKNLGIVFQEFFLIDHFTAFENVAVPLEIQNSYSKTKVESVLEAVGLKDRMDHYPEQLSGGEKQRVAIARAIVHEPSIILADEPTGNLDEVTGSLVENLLFEMIAKRNLAMILVTHDRNFAARCHQRFQLSHGKLLAS